MNTSSDDNLRIAKHLLLSSPPGQFQQILTDLKTISQNVNHVNMTDSNTRPKEEETNQSSILGFDLSPSFIKEVEILYNSRVGREIILSDLRVQQGQGMNDDDFGNILNDAFQEYVKGHFYNSKGNESNVVIHGVDDDDDDDDVGGKTYNVLMYTERIQLHQYHAGSWFAKYTNHRPTKDSKKLQWMEKFNYMHTHLKMEMFN